VSYCACGINRAGFAAAFLGGRASGFGCPCCGALLGCLGGGLVELSVLS
jgi:hypothetical protein